MANKMLIDASHPEETRVVVLRGNRIEEFDFESQDKKQLRGNIYLARVTRVEPSLQAAFVEYGGNRHGFLAFSEIHPDYYQIPVADRQALLKAEAEEAKAAEDDNNNDTDTGNGKKHRRSHSRQKTGEETSTALNGEQAPAQASQLHADLVAELADSESGDENSSANGSSNGSHSSNGSDGSDEVAEVDTVGAEDAFDEAQTRRRPVRRNYKIQEVIKRRQIMLVQVVKEERGNKGAALTTYLSLAGRYSVLMPNTARGGGISRKITNPQDRKRLKDIVKSLDVSEGMGVILRTAGANRTKAEIKRDYEYLLRLWERVRTLTLESVAPALVYEEGSLIKRSVRDLYNRDIDQILVAGEEGYREAKDFMRMLMPSHAKVVQPYRDSVPIFARNGIEAQLDKILQPQVTLKSGGYIIINQTEALVAIDVNSGRSTKEHSIEDTALQTNLEAAEEVARQLRLRDLAGLIVIDFIDMEESRNNRAVEKRLKECLKNDRARIQVGRISHFGLLEMSRQRIRTSVLESTMQPCSQCGGTGYVRSDSSLALLVVRAIEEFLLKDAQHDIVVHTPASTALYLLNHKRSNLVELETHFGVRITVETDEELGGQHYTIVKSGRGKVADMRPTVQNGVPEKAESDATSSEDQETELASPTDDEDGAHARKKRRKRRRRGGRDRADEPAETSAQEAQGEHVQEPIIDEAAEADAADAHDEVEEQSADRSASSADGERKKRHRGKRGGRRNRLKQEGLDPQAGVLEESDVPTETASEQSSQPVEETEQESEFSTTEPGSKDAPEAVLPTPEVQAEPSPEAEEPRPQTQAEPASEATDKTSPEQKPVKRTRRRSKSSDKETTTAAEKTPAIAQEAEGASASEEAEPAERKQRRKSPAIPAEEPQPEPIVVTSSDSDSEEAPRKTGWWQRRSFF